MNFPMLKPPFIGDFPLPFLLTGSVCLVPLGPVCRPLAGLGASGSKDDQAFAVLLP